MEAARESTTEPQEMTMPVPQKEHEWLRRLVGEWAFEGEVGGADQPAEHFQGSETVRSVGEIWITAEARVGAPDGTEAVNILTLGFDPRKGQFVGGFISTWMTHFWVYDGELDADGRALILNSEGPSMDAGGEMARFREIIEIVSDDTRTWTSFVEGGDGSWEEVMRSEYRRVQPRSVGG